MKRRMSKTDFIIVAIIVLTAVIGVFFVSSYSEGGDKVKISVNGEEFKTLSLDSEEKQVIDINGKNTLIIEEGHAYMAEADCEDQLCIKKGRIGQQGESIVCLPNKVVVEINESVVDVEDAAW